MKKQQTGDSLSLRYKTTLAYGHPSIEGISPPEEEYVDRREVGTESINYEK